MRQLFLLFRQKEVDDLYFFINIVTADRWSDVLFLLFVQVNHDVCHELFWGQLVVYRVHKVFVFCSSAV